MRKKTLFGVMIIIIGLLVLLATCDRDDLVGVTGKRYDNVTVTRVFPSSGAINIPTNTHLILEFSHSINQSTFNSSFRLYSHIGDINTSQYNFNWSNGSKRLILTPKDPNINTLHQTTIINVEVNTELRSHAGDPLMRTYHTSFGTLTAADTTPPNLVNHCIKSNPSFICSPPSAINNQNVYPFYGIEINFNEPMNPFTVEQSFVFSVGGSVKTPTSTTWSNNNQTVTFVYESAFYNQACEISLEVV